nr:tropomyosin, muscle-like [Nicotiana tomentosiformis]
MGIASYLRCLVTKEDRALMDAVEAPCLFNEAQQALNRELTKKRDTYKLLNERLLAELEVARKEHTEWVERVNRVLKDSDDELDSMANDSILQVDTIQAEAEEFKKHMDLVTSEKEVVQAQLALVEAQLRVAKEKTLVQAKKIEELQSEVNSVVSREESLAKESEVAKSEVVVVETKANAKVAQFKVDVEVIQAQDKIMVENKKPGPGKLDFPEDDSEILTKYEGGEDPEDEDASTSEDQAI